MKTQREGGRCVVMRLTKGPLFMHTLPLDTCNRMLKGQGGAGTRQSATLAKIRAGGPVIFSTIKRIENKYTHF